MVPIEPPPVHQLQLLHALLTIAAPAPAAPSGTGPEPAPTSAPLAPASLAAVPLSSPPFAPVALATATLAAVPLTATVPRVVGLAHGLLDARLHPGQVPLRAARSARQVVQVGAEGHEEVREDPVDVDARLLARGRRAEDAHDGFSLPSRRVSRGEAGRRGGGGGGGGATADVGVDAVMHVVVDDGHTHAEAGRALDVGDRGHGVRVCRGMRGLGAKRSRNRDEIQIGFSSHHVPLSAPPPWSSRPRPLVRGPGGVTGPRLDPLDPVGGRRMRRGGPQEVRHVSLYLLRE